MLDFKINEVVRTTKAHLADLQDVGIKTCKDLLFYFPWRYSDESEVSTIAEMCVGKVATVQVKVDSIFSRYTKTGKLMIVAKVSDRTGSLEVMWFNQSYLKQILTVGVKVMLTGVLKWSGSKGSLMSPKYEVIQQDVDLIHTGRLVPVYHESGRLSSKWFREKIRPILYVTQFLKDPIPDEILKKYDLMPLSKAVVEVHFPTSEEFLEKAKYRLGFEELFVIQLRAIQRKYLWKLASKKFDKQMSDSLLDSFIQSLPFSLTKAQKRSLNEVIVDIKSNFAMSRLLEGDVGSGKTVIAAAAIFLAVKSGFQACIMVPTEILAKQHFKSLFNYFKIFGINIQLLVGSLTKKQKEELVTGLKSGLINVVVGTHALIQESVGFANLGLAVIDEQHRFGVNQRAILKSFGAPHMLSMTATPIPRTLALTLYGDQDLSIIDELPPGRTEIVTRVVPEKKRDDAYSWIKNQVMAGRQAYVVCPLIEESETIEVKSAIIEYERLRASVFAEFRVGLLHGKMKQVEKDDVMLKFSNHEIDILVATTVIEVGIDVANASIIVIEAADRFGLAQLHQLRGRVGRGAYQSYCFLFPEYNSEQSRMRMKAMVDYTDGFKLAEIDLSLRGPGEVYGHRQSGIPDLKMASLSNHELLKLARDEAENLLKKDLLLKDFPELLKIVEKDDIVIDY